ncbi:CubicO group peptidase (beta-lactamase class C family) [Sphingomonas zeicaulis]|uniref:serine hydrolase domain-containing protein n=1 Tax=Sphingomonas zeicaulis TaxID=1632740 RepID=UPI003D1F088B
MRARAQRAFFGAEASDRPTAEGERPKTDAIATLRTRLTAMVNAGEIPNAQILITQNGKPLAAFRLGYSDIATKAPLPEDAIFRLYSMTKPITSVAIMMLAEEGRLSLKDPVGKYLPELADLRVYNAAAAAAAPDADPVPTVPATRAVTIEDLLLHASGITYEFMGDTPVQRYYRRHGVARATAAASGRDQAPPAATLAELVARLGKAPLLHQPGERFSYGFSTTVLGAVIERVSGKTLNAFYQRRIFDPLEMRDTRFVVDDARVARLVANTLATPTGLKLQENAATSEYRDPSRLRDAGGGLAGTIEDYRHFAEMLANRGTWHGRRLLRPETVDTMFTPRLRTGGAPEEDSMFGYGLALGDAETEAKGGLPKGAGSWAGSGNTYFFADPEHKLVAILMTNMLTPGPMAKRTYELRGLVNAAAVGVMRRE